MYTLIDDLLTLAREGAATPQLEPTDLGELARDSWRHTATTDATLAVKTGARVVADEGQLCRLLENLLRNAVEHGSTSNGGSETPRATGDAGDNRTRSDDAVTVTVTVGELDDGFYVADDGEGLPNGDLGRLLEYGVSTSTDGTGLGLSIVHEVVENHGWTLEVTEADVGEARFESRGVTMCPCDESDD